MHNVTFDRSAITPKEVRRAAVQVVGIYLAITLAIVIAGQLDGTIVDAIRAALEKDAKAPANAGIITSLLATVQGNWYWFLLGTLPLALSILLGAVALGVRSASDWLFKLLLGIVGIIAFAPAIVA